MFKEVTRVTPRAGRAQIARAHGFDLERPDFGKLYVFSHVEYDPLKIKILKWRESGFLGYYFLGPGPSSKTVEILYAKPSVVCSGDHDPRALVKHIKFVKFLKSTRWLDTCYPRATKRRKICEIPKKHGVTWCRLPACFMNRRKIPKSMRVACIKSPRAF